ncbi:CCHC-type domain-containing protein [Durusdinium trenchii]|uniref:CCHC-type domain-containing protein n=1 Tax=Durusdinium trenchii TaxID=1381693 RepID=A0ABP0PK46_9DINO
MQSSHALAVDATVSSPGNDSSVDISVESIEEPPQPRDLIGEVTEWVTNMQVVRPELVRAISCHVALRQFGYAFRKKTAADKARFFAQSRAAEHLDEFWSHSWQLSAWRKILSLMFLKNGLAAATIGSLFSLLGFTLSMLQILPSTFGFGGKVSFWSTLFGLLAFFGSLFFWRKPFKPERVFLDVCCINQLDNREKSEGILSLGGILRNSRRMLVLWDATYIERLWCVFELAAFIRSRPPEEAPEVQIRPTLLGTCALAVIFGVTSIVVCLATLISHQQQALSYLIVISVLLLLILYPAAATFRGYFHSVDTLCDQMSKFHLQETKCACCVQGHDESTPVCDRDIVTRCIRAWFGDEASFEKQMQVTVSASVAEHLGEHLFPYWLLLVASVPFMWVMLDIAVENLLFMKLGQFWLFWLITGFGWWIAAFPCCFCVFLFVAKVLRKPRRYLCCDLLTNFLVILGLLPAFVLIFGFEVLIFLFFPFEAQEWVLAAVSSCFHGLLAALVWNAPRICRRKAEETGAGR